MSYQRLIAEHDAIDALAAALGTMLDRPTAEPEAVVALLSELAMAIEEHRRNAHRIVYQRLLDGSNAAAAVTVAHFAEQFGVLEVEWHAYLGDWGADCIAADWEQFGVETRAALDHLLRRLRNEAAVIYPIALQRGAIRLRAA